MNETRVAAFPTGARTAEIVSGSAELNTQATARSTRIPKNPSAQSTAGNTQTARSSIISLPGIGGLNFMGTLADDASRSWATVVSIEVSDFGKLVRIDHDVLAIPPHINGSH